MKNMMWKTTFREIKQSLGRFLAILAIVALGVGLFSGLKVTKPFMIKTVEDYWLEKNFYDFRLVSTLGFEEEDVSYFAALPDVEAVEGSYSFDILYEYGSSEADNVIKTHSMPGEINRLELLAGRMPENVNECVVDSRLYGSDAIGETIRLSKENEEEDLENFAVQEFTITGIVQSSYYIQFERGNTSLGTGVVSGFMYLLPEAYDSEAYTEIFVKFNQDFPLYDGAYDTFIEQKETEWEEYLTIAANRRYEDILGEANKELADAKAEFAEEKADAEREFADAKKELEEAAIEIADGKQEIADAKIEIADAKKELADAEKELADGEKELADGERELADAERELADGEKEYLEAKEAYDFDCNLVDSGLGEAEAGMAQLKLKENELLQQEAMLLQYEAGILGAEQQLIAAFAPNPVPADLPEAIQIAAAKAEIANNKAQIEAGKQQLAGAIAEVDSALGTLGEAKNLLNSAYMQLQDAYNEIERGKVEIADAKRELEEGRQEIIDGKKELADAREELADAEIELADAEAELAEGEVEYLDGLKEYEDGFREFQEEIADAEAEIADAEAEIADIEAPDTYVLGRDTNVGYMCLDSDSNIVADVAVVFPVFFFLVAALVCMTTMNRMIEEQRTQIGVLKALGYSNSAIMGKYLFYSGSAALVGCISGFFVGTYVLAKIIWDAYKMIYDVGGLCFYIDWPIAIFSIICSLLCSMGVTWYSCRKELQEVAASLMRPKAPKAGKRIFLEYIPFIWKRLKFLQKVSIRNVLRYKKRFFMMVIGISGCTALLVTGFGINDSISDVVNTQYKEILLYDMSVTFQKMPGEEKLAECEAVMENRIEQYDMLLETAVDIRAKDRTKSIYLIVPEKPENFTAYVDLHTLEGEPLSFPGPGEVVITHKLARDFGLQVGDVIELLDENYKVLQATISGINQNFVYSYVFLHPDTYTEQWQAPEYKSAYINLPKEGNADAHQLSADLMKLEEIANVTICKDIAERFNSMLGSMDFIVFVIILCAAALAFIVLYNLTNINITERVREIATIKVLGFYKKETTTYVFRENLMLTAIGAFVGLFLGKVFHAFVISCINVEMVAFDVRINPPSYVYSILFTFGFAWLVNTFMSGKIDRVSMTESLKSVD